MKDRNINQAIAKVCLKSNSKASYLTSDNILFKLIDGKIIGKKGVDTHLTGWRWMEEIKDNSEILTNTHPQGSDFNEVFIL